MKKRANSIDIHLFNAIKELNSVFEKSWGNTALIEYHWSKMSRKTKRKLKELSNGK